MKIAFLGDSLTEGFPGVSYFDMLVKQVSNHTLHNLGKGGDTVKSLHKRISKLDLSQYDVLILFIGVNDVFGKINRSHKLLRALQGQSPSKSKDSFILEYKELMEYLLKFQKKLIVLPPLLLGEEIDSQWNSLLREYEVEIELIVKNFDVPYLDVQRKMYDFLQDKQQSSYLPLSIKEIVNDVTTLSTNEDIDLKSTTRGLHLTLDGVHLNTKGADFVSKTILKEIKKL